MSPKRGRDISKFVTTSCYIYIETYFLQVKCEIIVSIQALYYVPSQRKDLHKYKYRLVNPLNPELNPICYLLALLGAYHFLHVSRIKVKLLTFRLLMSYIYIYMEHPFLMFLDHTQRRSTVGRTPLDE